MTSLTCIGNSVSRAPAVTAIAICTTKPAEAAHHDRRGRALVLIDDGRDHRLVGQFSRNIRAKMPAIAPMFMGSI